VAALELGDCQGGGVLETLGFEGWVVDEIEAVVAEDVAGAGFDDCFP
jgi:hypothetical protein